MNVLEARGKLAKNIIFKGEIRNCALFEFES